LTKITDQIVCLLSDDHASAIVWGKEEEVADLDDNDIDKDLDRMYTFSVAKTREEEENVTISPGFKVCIQC
jgi:hypothetical protein